MRRKNLANPLISRPLCWLSRQADTPVDSRTRRAGFTFVEMLLVTAMMSVISLAVYSTLSNGIKIWQNINKQLPQEDLDIFFDRFSYDLRNSFKFTGIDFSGKDYSLEFATIVNSLRLKKKIVGKVAYYYSARSEKLSREEKDFTQLFSGGEAKAKQSINNVASLKFQYYIYDTEKKQYIWQDEWQADGIPSAVRMEMELKDGTKTNRFTKTVSIPLGG